MGKMSFFLKNSLLIVICLFLFSGPVNGQTIGKFSNGSAIDTCDVVYLLVYALQGSVNLQSRAEGLYSGCKERTIISIPTLATADLNNDGFIDTADVVLLLAYVLGAQGFDGISNRARNLYPGYVKTMEKMPGTLLGNSAITIKIDGITIDP